MAEGGIEEYSMKQEHKDILRKNRATLEQNIEPKQLLSHLHEILSEEDCEAVLAEKTRTDQARELLDQLPLKGPTAFDCFVNSLMKVQRHLARFLLEAAGRKLPMKFDDDEVILPQDTRSRLRQPKLREMLKEVNIDKIMTAMKNIGTFNDAEEEHIKSKHVGDDKWAEFLKILPLKGLKGYNCFIGALEFMNYVKVANFLKGNDCSTPVNIVYQTPVSKLKGRLQEFCLVTNEDDRWKGLAQECQVSIEKYEKSLDPTKEIINDWTTRNGDMANVSILQQYLERQNLQSSKQSLEKVLNSNITCVDAPTGKPMEDLTDKIHNLNMGDDYPGDDQEKTELPVPKMLHDLESSMLTRLREQISSEIKQQKNTISIDTENNCPIRALTKQLRNNNLKESIKWMKRNLPAGVTGPLQDDTMNVRDMPYRVRGPLTRHLTVDGKWKLLAERLKLEKIQIDFFDQRDRNPADEVLKTWETKRNSKIGDFYDILVELELPVIADIL